MSYVLYLGCLIPSRLPFLEKSVKTMLDRLGVDYVETEEFSCCCDPIIGKSLSLDAWLAIAARNIAVAEELGSDILTSCNGCYASLNEANHILKSDEELRKAANSMLKEVGKEFKGTIDVLPLTKVVHDLGKDKIAKLVTNEMDLKVAPHYGCHLILPEKVPRMDSSRNPKIIDTLSEWVGAEAVDYSNSPMCCGSGLNSIKKETSSEMLSEIVGLMQEEGATHIVTPCPFCFLQFDKGQEKEQEKLPVLYISDLYNLAFGASPEEMGLKYHKVQVP
jgi:heterodisulfide reductase subunit B